MPSGRRTVGVAVAALAVVVLALLAWNVARPAPSAGTGQFVPASAPVFPTPIHHVFVVMFENAEIGNVLQNGSYERYLAGTYAEAGQYYSLEHYSLPNYLAITSGTASNLFKVEKAKNLGDLASAANETWKGEEQSMPFPCDTASTGDYDIMHNPWVMYADVVNQPKRCDQHVVNFTAFPAPNTTGTYANYNLVVPNLADDGHNTNVSIGDSWLRGFLSPLINSSVFKSSVFFLTYDEGTTNLGTGNSTGGGHVYFVAVSPYAVKGFDSTVQYSDYNVLTTTEWLLGLGHTGHNDNWSTFAPMYDLFSFPPAHHHGPMVGPGASMDLRTVSSALPGRRP